MCEFKKEIYVQLPRKRDGGHFWLKFVSENK